MKLNITNVFIVYFQRCAPSFAGLWDPVSIFKTVQRQQKRHYTNLYACHFSIFFYLLVSWKKYFFHEMYIIWVYIYIYFQMEVFNACLLKLIWIDVNPFLPYVSLWYPKNIRKPKVFWFFQGFKRVNRQ